MHEIIRVMRWMMTMMTVVMKGRIAQRVPMLLLIITVVYEE